MLKTVAACGAGVSALLAAAGFITEKSYSQLLGMNLEGSAPNLLYSGVDFFITLLTVSLVITIPAVGVVLTGAVLLGLSRWVFPTIRMPAVFWTLANTHWALVVVQALVYLAMLLFALPRFADLLPLVAVATHARPSELPLDTLRDGHNLYRFVVVLVAISILLLAGLEAWRIWLRSQERQEHPASMALAFLLSIPLYLLVLVETLFLPIGHGLLILPSSRKYTTLEVKFKNSAIEDSVRGHALLLLELSRSAKELTLYCPQNAISLPENEDNIEWTRDREKRSIVKFLEEFKDRDCAAPLPGKK